MFNSVYKTSQQYGKLTVVVVVACAVLLLWYLLSISNLQSVNIFINSNRNQTIFSKKYHIRNVSINISYYYNLHLPETDKIWLNINDSYKYTEKQLKQEKELYKYDEIEDFNKCGLNKQLLIWIAHHKTGSKAFYIMSRFILKTCIANHTYSRLLVNEKYFVYWWVATRHVLTSTVETVIKKHHLSNIRIKRKKYIINNNINSINTSNKLKINYINMMRDPVSVIISVKI